MILLKQTCQAVGYQMDLPLLQNNIRHGISRISKPFQNEQTMEADCKKQAKKRYVHANNHIIKAFRGEQTLMGRNDRYNLI